MNFNLIVQKFSLAGFVMDNKSPDLDYEIGRDKSSLYTSLLANIPSVIIKFLPAPVISVI